MAFRLYLILTILVTKGLADTMTPGTPPSRDVTWYSYLLPKQPLNSHSVRPNAGGPPVKVEITLYISDIELKDNRMIVVNYQRLTWNDPRLKHDKGQKLVFKLEDIQSQIWTPDIFHPNAVEPTQLINKGYVRILSNGDVVLSQLEKETVKCPGATLGASLFLSPHIECTIETESYGFSTADILLVPKGNSSISIDVAAMNDGIYKVTNFSTAETTQVLSVGNYSRISYKIVFESALKDTPKGSLMNLLERRGRH